MFKKPMSKFLAHSTLRLNNLSISLLSDSLIDPDELFADESLLEFEIRETDGVKLIGENGVDIFSEDMHKMSEPLSITFVFVDCSTLLMKKKIVLVSRF